jgi:hypothetical protein
MTRDKNCTVHADLKHGGLALRARYFHFKKTVQRVYLEAHTARAGKFGSTVARVQIYWFQLYVLELPEVLARGRMCRGSP